MWLACNSLHSIPTTVIFWVNLATDPFHSQKNFCRIRNKILIHIYRWTEMMNMTTTKTTKIIYVMEFTCKTLIFTYTLWNPRVLCITIWETVLDTLDMANAASWRMEFLLTTLHISAQIMILALSFWLAGSNILLWMFTFSLLSWSSSYLPLLSI
jgi:type IV secretory pathway TrbD component